MSITIKVTEEHIARGIRGDGHNCPLALAIQQSTGLSCIVGGRSVWINHDKWYKLSDKAIAFVLSFDEYGRECVAPATFILKAA